MSEKAVPVTAFQTLVGTACWSSRVPSLERQWFDNFFELGELAQPGPRRIHAKGEACIWIDWDWRVESGSSVLYGSSNSRPKIQSGILGLKGSTLQSLSVVGQVPELVAEFSNHHRLSSMAMHTGDPEWSIRLPDRRWIHGRNGVLTVGDGGSQAMIAEEQNSSDLSERTTARWGVPVTEPKFGDCADCTSFVRLDGDFYFLDYGVCTASGGPFDGRSVHVNSGCPCFSRAAEVS